MPSTLNKVVTLPNGTAVLQPFPSWEANCLEPSCIVYVQSMEVDPVNNWMWILDVGRVRGCQTVLPDVCRHCRVHGP